MFKAIYILALDVYRFKNKNDSLKQLLKDFFVGNDFKLKLDQFSAVYKLVAIEAIQSSISGNSFSIIAKLRGLYFLQPPNDLFCY